MDILTLPKKNLNPLQLSLKPNPLLLLRPFQQLLNIPVILRLQRLHRLEVLHHLHP
jgi:hypothetical protein